MPPAMVGALMPLTAMMEPALIDWKVTAPIVPFVAVPSPVEEITRAELLTELPTAPVLMLFRPSTDTSLIETFAETLPVFSMSKLTSPNATLASALPA